MGIVESTQKGGTVGLATRKFRSHRCQSLFRRRQRISDRRELTSHSLESGLKGVPFQLDCNLGIFNGRQLPATYGRFAPVGQERSSPRRLRREVVKLFVVRSPI